MVSAVAATNETEALGALALHARGAFELVAGEPQAAVAPLRQAFELLHQLAAPYLAARARAVLGCAYQALDDEDGAKLEIAAARSTFGSVGVTIATTLSTPNGGTALVRAITTRVWPGASSPSPSPSSG